MNLKSTIIQRLSGKESILKRFINAQKLVIIDMLKTICQSRSQNLDESKSSNPVLSMDTIKIVCLTLAMLNTEDPLICCKIK